MGKWCLHASLFLGNKDMSKNYKRFDFWYVQTADIGGTKPWKNNCSLIWKLFKFLMTILAGLFEMKGCWHIGLRWAIVALWTTCFLPKDPSFLHSGSEDSDQSGRMPRLIWVFAGRIVILLVLSWRGSNILIQSARIEESTWHKLVKLYFTSIWATTWQNQQNECAPSEDSDQPGHPPSLIRFFAVRSMGS